MNTVHRVQSEKLSKGSPPSLAQKIISPPYVSHSQSLWLSTFHFDLLSCVNSMALSKEHGIKLTLSPISCVSMDQFLNYSKHHFLRLKNRDIVAFYVDLDQDILKYQYVNIHKDTPNRKI